MVAPGLFERPIVFAGTDKGAFDKTPPFIKSIPVWKAVEDTTLIAYEMNGQPLPHWNGFPARIVVPGWTATYWMKHVARIDAVTKPFDGFWMKSAYRIPLGTGGIGWRCRVQRQRRGPRVGTAAGHGPRQQPDRPDAGGGFNRKPSWLPSQRHPDSQPRCGMRRTLCGR